MAYVVARRNKRFEIRESLHTPKGPRSRTLAGFEVLTDDVLAAASARAQRPFDAQAVIRSSRRAGASVWAEDSIASGGHSVRVGDSIASGSREKFVAGSRRMASTLARVGPTGTEGEGADAGVALIELLGFADAVTAGQSPRPFEPLAFPAIASLAGAHGVSRS